MNKLHFITTPLKVVSHAHPSQIKCKVRRQKGLYTCKSRCFHKRAKGPSRKQLMSIFDWVYTVSHFDINVL